MIRYRRLYESENSDIKLYDVVNCAGHDWYVIDIDGDIITLLSKNGFGSLPFSEDGSIDYVDSDVRSYLLRDVLPKLKRKGVNPILTDISDVGCSDEIWLLSSREAARVPKEIRKLRRAIEWWLRSKSSLAYNGYVPYVDTLGQVDNGGNTPQYPYGIVRPAMRVRIEDLEE